MLLGFSFHWSGHPTLPTHRVGGMRPGLYPTRQVARGRKTGWVAIGLGAVRPSCAPRWRGSFSRRRKTCHPGVNLCLGATLIQRVIPLYQANQRRAVTAELLDLFLGKPRPVRRNPRTKEVPARFHVMPRDRVHGTTDGDEGLEWQPPPGPRLAGLMTVKLVVDQAPGKSRQR